MAVVPVTVPGQDRVLVRHDDVVVAVVGVRAYPQAVMFQLLIKTRFAGDEHPELAFRLPRELRAGNFEFGADLCDADGQWRATEVKFAGGGGGGEADGMGSYEFKWWVPLSDTDRGLRLWCAWGKRGVPRSIAELDLDLVLAASRASESVWPA